MAATEENGDLRGGRAAAPDAVAPLPGSARALKELQKKKGKGGQPWFKDDAVLRRLQLVRDLVAQGVTSLRGIMLALGQAGVEVTLPTVSKDLERLRQVRRVELGLDMEDAVRVHVDRLQRALSKAWQSFGAARAGTRDAAYHLEVIDKILASLAKVQDLNPSDRRAPKEGSDFGAYLTALAAFESAQRASFLAAASDDDLTPRDRDTGDLVAEAYRRFGKVIDVEPSRAAPAARPVAAGATARAPSSSPALERIAAGLLAAAPPVFGDEDEDDDDDPAVLPF